MTIEAKLDETNKLLGEILRAVSVGVTAVASTPATAAPKAPTKAQLAAAQKAADEKKAAEAAAAAPKAADEDFNFDEPAVEEKKLTVEDARKALVDLQKAKKSPEASRGVLNKLGITSLAVLKNDMQEKIKAVIEGCEKLMPTPKA